MRVSSTAIAILAVLAAPPAWGEPVNETLEIDTVTGKHPFTIELVRSDADMEKGLMFRRSMPADHGMLFDFARPQPVRMWMKNTYLPLDMVFIDPHGKVINVAERTVPMSEAIIPSGGDALGVLEVNAGIAHKIGLKAGDTVMASIFAKDEGR